MSDYDKEKQRYQQFFNPISGRERSGKQEEIRTTPLFTLAVKHAVDHASDNSLSSAHRSNDVSTPMNSTSAVESKPATDAQDKPHTKSSDDESVSCSSSESAENPLVNGKIQGSGEVLPEYALLGYHVGAHPQIGVSEPIFMNVNAPNSAFICGSQGSGKSYTLSCMLENCLLPDPRFGKVHSPIAGVLFHYDVDSAGSIAEAANLCSRGIKVNVLVSPSNEYVLRGAYSKVSKGANAVNIQVMRFNTTDLSIERIHKLMAFSEKEGAVPLYMEVAQRILREMAIAARGQLFNYFHFKRSLLQETLSRDQMSPLNLRLNLLESFLDMPAEQPQQQQQQQHHQHQKRSKSSIPQVHPGRPVFSLAPGSLTIVDLSDPFIDAATVCVLFDICLGILLERRPPGGLVVALDEAHKFLGRSSAAANHFTDRLLTTVREQRHSGVRVIVATQEPTVSEKLLDLCSVSIVHRFSSPAWFAAIKGHLGGAAEVLTKQKRGVSETEGEDEDERSMFERIVELQVGESLVFAPSAYVRLGAKDGLPRKLGATAMRMKTRMRLGTDGGMSVLALR